MNQTLTGNTIQLSTEAGLNIIENGGGGSGSIYNNYFGNDLNVCATASSASQYHWNNTEPTLGTNIVGGKYLAGNYWSNAAGNGWSDKQTPNESGYSFTAYEIVSGVYDENPLIKTTPTPTSTTDEESEYYFTDHTDPTPDTTGIHIVIVTLTLPDGTVAGDTALLTLILKNTGTIQLSSEARVVLAPVGVLAQSVGEQSLEYKDGEYVLTFPLNILSLPGTYTYTFKPVQITRDPITGKDIRIPAGDPIQFTITVISDGTVAVSSP